MSFIASFNQFNQKKLAINYNQLHTVKLIDSDFVAPTFQSQLPLPTQTYHQQWNIVIFVLESVGSKYVFQELDKNTIPMPFLKWLSKRGTWFENAYSSGNISALGQFSILTGIYPNPTPTHFEMQNNVHIPTIATWLGKSYDSFLVTASNNTYFSKNTFQTFSEYDNAEVIHPNIHELFFNMFIDENEAFIFFKNRLNRATTPFVALYWSSATHFPYNDFKFKHPIMSNTNNPYARYINNLNLLDHEIEQTYKMLKSKHLLDRTIFVIVGDHGEIFGQHNNLQAHGRSLYLDEIKIPLLIYAPKLLKPQVIREPISSIDILPTILDALNIPYGNQIQGESCLRNIRNRKYVFIYGDEDEIAAVDLHHMKMNISFSENTCNAYDLTNDPNENNPLPCINTKQQDAILKFRRYQPRILNWYNHLCNANPINS